MIRSIPLLSGTRAGRVAPAAVSSLVCSCACLERAEEGDEVGLLAVGELDVEAGVVEVDDLVEVLGEAVVEVRKGRSKTRLLSTHCNPFKCFRAARSR